MLSDGPSFQPMKIWTSAHARENHLSQHVCSTSRPDDQTEKTEVMMLNVPNPSSFNYLDSIVQQDGRAGSDIRNCLKKARNVCTMLNNEWKTVQELPTFQPPVRLRMLEDD